MTQATAEPKATKAAAVLAFERPLTKVEVFNQMQHSVLVDIGARRAPIADEIKSLGGAPKERPNGIYFPRHVAERISALNKQLEDLDYEAASASAGTHPRLTAFRIDTATINRETYEVALKRFNELLTPELRGAAGDLVNACKPMLLRCPEAAIAIQNA